MWRSCAARCLRQGPSAHSLLSCVEAHAAAATINHDPPLRTVVIANLPDAPRLGPARGDLGRPRRTSIRTASASSMRGLTCWPGPTCRSPKVSVTLPLYATEPSGGRVSADGAATSPPSWQVSERPDLPGTWCSTPPIHRVGPAHSAAPTHLTARAVPGRRRARPPRRRQRHRPPGFLCL